MDKVLDQFAQNHLGNLVARIPDALLISENPNDFRSLLGSLVSNESLTTTNALLDLAKYERPWIWFPSVVRRLWKRKKPCHRKKKLTSQEKLRRDAVSGGHGFVGERNHGPPPVHRSRPSSSGCLTPEVKLMAIEWPYCFHSAFLQFHSYCDRETSTRALVEAAQSWTPWVR